MLKESEMSIQNGYCGAWYLLIGGKSFKDVLLSLWVSHTIFTQVNILRFRIRGQGDTEELEVKSSLRQGGPAPRRSQKIIVVAINMKCALALNPALCRAFYVAHWI